MKGSIFYDKRMKRWCVLWYDPSVKRTRHIWRYKGMEMEGRSLAVKLLSAMQGDLENGIFRIEKFLNNDTDVIPYLREWLEHIRQLFCPYKINHLQSTKIAVKPISNLNTNSRTHF